MGWLLPVTSQSCFNYAGRSTYPLIVVGAAAGIYKLSQSPREEQRRLLKHKPGQVCSRGRTEWERRFSEGPHHNIHMNNPLNWFTSLSWSLIAFICWVSFRTLSNKQTHRVVWSVTLRLGPSFWIFDLRLLEIFFCHVRVNSSHMLFHFWYSE